MKHFTLREGMMKVGQSGSMMKVAPMPAKQTGSEANQMKMNQTLKREVVRNTVEVELKAINVSQ